MTLEQLQKLPDLVEDLKNQIDELKKIEPKEEKFVHKLEFHNYDRDLKYYFATCTCGRVYYDYSNSMFLLSKHIAEESKKEISNGKEY